MNEDRETAYPAVLGFLALLVVALFLSVYFHRQSNRVTVELTHPVPGASAGYQN